MSYNRTPNTVLAGRGLKQSPSQTGLTPVGVVTVTVDGDIATSSSLGLVQIGAGLIITPSGILSAINSSDSLVNVKLTAINYTALLTDYYIGATKKGVTITLPLGIAGKIFIIKNQVSGNITVNCSGGQTLDSAASKVLGSDSHITVVFDGTRWNII